MREEKEIRAHALDAARLGIWDFEVESGRYFGDERCRELYGVPAAASLSAENVLELIHPDDRDRVGAAVAAARDPASDGRYEAEYRIRLPDGSDRWIAARGRVYFAGEGPERRPVRFSGVVLDLGEARKAAAAARESEQLFRNIFENAAVGIAQVDLEGRWVRFNAKLSQILGYPAEELKEKNFQDLTFPADLDSDLERMNKVLAGEIDSYTMEKRFIHRDGRRIWTTITVSLVRDAEGRPAHLIKIVRDITWRKEMEEELLRAKEAAEEGSRVKTAFLNNISHELRTPMTVIMAACDQLLPSMTSSRPRRLLEMACRANDRLLALIDDLLDFSRLETEEVEIVREPFGLRACLDEALTRWKPAAAEKGLRLELEVPAEMADRRQGDAKRIGQVLDKLLGNAVRFTECGGVTVSVRATPDPARDDILFSVRDTGIGIPADKLHLLFDAFSQVDPSLTRRHGGTGLGLAICRKLVERMGGKIEVASEDGRGSTFTFELPLPVAEPAEAQPERSVAPSRPTILLVEDDPMVRDLLEMVLRQGEMEVVTAADGREGLEKWGAGKIDLVLMDVQMPVMDGLEATRQIRRREAGTGRSTPILAVTAHAGPENEIACRQAGMDGCLTKPINMKRLQTAVREALGQASDLG